MRPALLLLMAASLSLGCDGVVVDVNLPDAGLSPGAPLCVFSGSDLRLSDVTWTPTALTQSAHVVFGATVTNTGCAATPADLSFHLAFTVDGQAVSASADQTTVIEAGSSVTASAAGSVNYWVATAGTHALTTSLAADPVTATPSSLQATLTVSPLPPVAPDPTRSAGCGSKPTHGMTPRTVTIANQARTYDLYIPDGVTGSDALPLVIVYHGRGATSADAAAFGLQQAAAAAGQQGIFAFPQAAFYAPEGATGWQSFNTSDVDLQFTDAIVKATEDALCIDTTRVFAAGFSWGADMVIDLSCFRGDLFRAVSPFAGTPDGKGACTAKRSAIRETIGTADTNYSVSSVDRVISGFVTAQHCKSTTQASSPAPDVCLAHDGCDVPVIECKYPGMGHQVPPSGGADAWTFFSSFH